MAVVMFSKFEVLICVTEASTSGPLRTANANLQPTACPCTTYNSIHFRKHIDTAPKLTKMAPSKQDCSPSLPLTSALSQPSRTSSNPLVSASLLQSLRAVAGIAPDAPRRSVLDILDDAINLESNCQEAKRTSVTNKKPPSGPAEQ